MLDVLPFSLHGPDVLPFWQLVRRPALLVKGQDFEGAPGISKGQHVGDIAKNGGTLSMSAANLPDVLPFF